MEEELELAFSYSAGEFLDEELESLEERFGKLDFIVNGVVKINKESHHKYEYWCAKDAIDELNTLLHQNDIKIEIVLQSKEELELLKDIFTHTTTNEICSLLKNRRNNAKNIDPILVMELCSNMCDSIRKL